MRKYRIHNRPQSALACLLAALCFLPGCADNKSAMTDAELERIAVTQKIKLVEGAGGLVITVGGDTLTSDEVLNYSIERDGRTITLVENLKPLAKNSDLPKFKNEARKRVEDIVIAKVSDILLYQHAKRTIGSNADEPLEKLAAKHLKEFMLKFDNDEARADQELAKMGLDRKKFKEERKKYMLTQSYLASKVPYDRPITYREMLDFYNTRKDEMFFKPGLLRFRLVDIRPDKIRLADPNQDRLEHAAEIARTLVEKLNAADDFDKLADQLDDPGITALTVLWKPYNPDSLVPPYDMLARKAEKIPEGAVAGPISADERIFIMKLEEKQLPGYEPFENVQKQIEDEIAYMRRNEVIDRLNEKINSQAEAGQTEDFTDFCLEKLYRICNQ